MIDNSEQASLITEVVEVTPEMAAVWLASAAMNRSLRVSQVAKYASDMSAGRWHLTGAPLQFSVSGRLLDGQHRLKAIIKSGVTVPILVVKGLPDSSQQFMDVGTKRSVSDQLRIAGYRHAPISASSGRLIIAWQTNRLGRNRISSITDSEVREFVEANPAIADIAGFASHVRREGLEVPASVIVATVWRARERGHNETLTKDFFQAMAEMRSDGRGDPRYVLLQRISKARRSRELIDAPTMLSLVVRAYNAHYTGVEIKILKAVFQGGAIEVPPIVDAKERNSEIRRKARHIYGDSDILVEILDGSELA